MSEPTIDTEERPALTLLREGLSERDQERMREAAHRLLSQSSILRERNAERQLYDWCVEHQSWLEEWGQLLGMKIIIQRDERIIMALPEVPALTRKLKRDETLVALALWYDYDVEVRENGAHDVFFTVRSFNEEFRSKFPSLQPLSASRMKEILRLFARLNLIEMEWESDFSSCVIQVLPTLRFAVPFPSIEEWVRVRDYFVKEEDEALDDGASDEAGEEETSDDLETV